LAAQFKKFLRSVGVAPFLSADPGAAVAEVQTLFGSAVSSANTAVSLLSVSSQARKVSASLDQMLNTADVLAFEYQEIRGAEVQKLGRLFDVSKVPPEGFNTPKFSARYDSVRDVDIQRVMDEIKASEPSLIYATVCDLNLYLLTHHAECCLDWTGDPQSDFHGNRMKRKRRPRQSIPQAVPRRRLLHAGSPGERGAVSRQGDG
jgi:hypothetical protein